MKVRWEHGFAASIHSTPHPCDAKEPTTCFSPSARLLATPHPSPLTSYSTRINVGPGRPLGRYELVNGELRSPQRPHEHSRCSSRIIHGLLPSALLDTGMNMGV